MLEGLKTNHLKYTDFIPYFQWLVVEGDLESIKALFEVFRSVKHSVLKMLNSCLKNVKSVDVHQGASAETDEATLLKLFLSYVRDKDLRPRLMNRAGNDQTVFQWVASQCEAELLQYTMTRDKQLMTDLLLQDEHSMICDQIASKDGL